MVLVLYRSATIDLVRNVQITVLLNQDSVGIETKTMESFEKTKKNTCLVRKTNCFHSPYKALVHIPVIFSFPSTKSGVQFVSLFNYHLDT